MNASLLLGVVVLLQSPETGREVIFEEDGFRIELDRSDQVIRLTMPEDVETAERGGGRRIETPLLPTLPDHDRWGRGMVSASILAQKAKIFDDRLLAHLERALQDGIGDTPGKAEILQSIAAELAEDDATGQAGNVILAAARLGSPDPNELPDVRSAAVDSLVERFEADRGRSKPIGFYQGSPELERIFRQDRMLQTAWNDRGEVAQLASLVASMPSIEEAYSTHLEVTAHLTNPPSSRYTSLLPFLDGQASGIPDGVQVAFFPPSRSVEADLMVEMFGNRSIPEDFRLGDELIRRLRSGELDPAPGDDSGWYDYQLWAAAPLVEPEETVEAEHLQFGPRYQEQLEDLFKAIVALSRESHVKQLEEPSTGSMAAQVFVYPDLDAEPLTTYYLRRAAGYRFVSRELSRIFGPEVLDGPGSTDIGGDAESLRDQLERMENLFAGAYVAVTRQIGGLPDNAFPRELGTFDLDRATEVFTAWREQLGDDPDLASDQRMMVPLFYDVERKKTKVWAFLGWAERPLRVDFVTRPEVHLIGEPPEDFDVEYPVVFMNSKPVLYYPVMAELYVDEVMDREEFRALCDRHKTRSAILDNIEPGGLRALFRGDRRSASLWGIGIGVALMLVAGSVIATAKRRRARRQAGP